MHYKTPTMPVREEIYNANELEGFSWLNWKYVDDVRYDDVYYKEYEYDPVEGISIMMFYWPDKNECYFQLFVKETLAHTRYEYVDDGLSWAQVRDEISQGYEYLRNKTFADEE